MNNDQFRKLILANNASKSKDASSPPSATPGGSALGSRQRSSIPMTPRSLGGSQADFARQLSDRNRATKPQKHFRTSAPKGARLADGYTDRAREREAGDADDDRATRLKALEESLKKEEIDQDTYEKLRFEIAGGDLGSTHLVKGLDFKLLERIRRGEDVYGEKEPEKQGQEDVAEDVDEAFEELEKQEVTAAAKEKQEKKKKGQLSTVSLNAAKKRSRDQILAELKASRAAAKAAAEPALGDRFRRIGAVQKAGSRIEIDSKGREVLIVVDEDGHEKRKVRKVQPSQPEAEAEASELPMPDKSAKPLGMEVPEQYKKAPEPEEGLDVDIFDDVGDDYDPLAGLDGSDSDSDEQPETSLKNDDAKTTEETRASAQDQLAMPPPPRPKRNYFENSKTGLVSEQQIKAPSMSDPEIQAAFKRAAALEQNRRRQGQETEDSDEDDEEAHARKAREERHRKLLESAARDDDDLDMGFGTSRFEDEEDFDETKVKISKWGADDEDGEGQDKGGVKRKRGPKKRKGDANNAADVLRVMESRKKSQ
ncbi:uncharacterized protein J7T54_006008 [Emericellopsis cladophorae]|uniref:RED-like N-terminal domain-containing protein n=1 Tax=Emericellopsis cladophorae TaxID=2686198 RepID=A0A9Q0BIJ3_9HYPO|nr:uncharacterized protein J7T54_006008 [Emericellopsis cladophorae]KAI6785674.1 hypothetical protein J7T54_006008 [Emericellopsis cladophorae]